MKKKIEPENYKFWLMVGLVVAAWLAFFIEQNSHKESEDYAEACSTDLRNEAKTMQDAINNLKEAKATIKDLRIKYAEALSGIEKLEAMEKPDNEWPPHFANEMFPQVHNGMK